MPLISFSSTTCWWKFSLWTIARYSCLNLQSLWLVFQAPHVDENPAYGQLQGILAISKFAMPLISFSSTTCWWKFSLWTIARYSCLNLQSLWLVFQAPHVDENPAYGQLQGILAISKFAMSPISFSGTTCWWKSGLWTIARYSCYI